jgi:cellobiose-specific phosphotransferase system component IIA
MLQDVSFQIIHHVGSKHSNVEDALSKNPVEWAEEDEEIQDAAN